METDMEKLSLDKSNNTDEDIEYDALSINILNDDCLIQVFMYLPLSDKVRLERVCKRWKAVSRASWQNFKVLNGSRKLWGMRLFDDEEMDSHKVSSVYREILKKGGQFLTHIDLSDIDIESDILYQVGYLCPNLESICIEHVTLNNSAIKALANCSNTTKFVFTSTSKKCKDNHLSTLFLGMKNLRYLKLTNNDSLTGEFLSYLPKDSMETIILNECANILPRHISNISSHLGKLHTLDLSNTISEGSGGFITALPKGLKVLRIRGYFEIVYEAIYTLTNLEVLDISETEIQNQFLIKLAENCKELVTLIIEGALEITNKGVREVAALPKLEELSVKDSFNITSNAFPYMPKIRKLNCSGCSMKEIGTFKLIETCDTLELLDLSGCKDISNKILKRAVEATKRRTNGIILKLILIKTSVSPKGVSEKSPLLELILPNEAESDSDDDFFLGPCGYGFMKNDYVFYEDGGYDYIGDLIDPDDLYH